MKVKYLIMWALLGCFIPGSLVAQNREFEEFKRRRNEEREKFEKERQLEFAEFLRRSWEEFEVYSGRRRPTIPEPVEPPVADPTEETPDTELPATPDPIIIPQVPQEPEPPREEIPQRPVVPDGDYAQARIDLLGNVLTINYDKAFTQPLTKTSEDGVADYWTMLTNAGYEEFLYQCYVIKTDLKLNDWGYYILISDITDAIYSRSQHNEKVVFTAFMMDNSGYRVRMASDPGNGKLLLMVAIGDQIYERSFYRLSNENYYLMDKASTGSINTYAEDPNPGYKRALRMIIGEAVKTGPDTKEAVVESSTMGGPLKVSYSPQMVRFYDRMPLCDLSVYFNSQCSEQVASSLDKAVGEKLRGKAPKQQIEMILKFIHEGFPYKTDGEQFGREKFFFYEELFAYPYSDCEDNSVLFAYLVKKYTGLKVVGLLYDDHAATAVKFNESVEGSYVTFKGEKYTVCDPTYFGARIGQSMPQYQNKSAQIIEIY